MKRIWWHFVVSAVLTQAIAFAQQPGDASSNPRGPERGNIVNSVYVNETLGFSFPIPEGWEVTSDNGEVQANVSPGGAQILLVIEQYPGGPLRKRIVKSPG